MSEKIIISFKRANTVKELNQAPADLTWVAFNCFNIMIVTEEPELSRLITNLSEVIQAKVYSKHNNRYGIPRGDEFNVLITFADEADEAEFILKHHTGVEIPW